MLKKLLAVLTVCFAVSGCSDTVQMITREDAELDQIQMEELKEKIDDKDTFVLFVSQGSCQDCKLLERTCLLYTSIVQLKGVVGIDLQCFALQILRCQMQLL